MQPGTESPIMFEGFVWWYLGMFIVCLLGTFTEFAQYCAEQKCTEKKMLTFLSNGISFIFMSECFKYCGISRGLLVEVCPCPWGCRPKSIWHELRACKPIIPIWFVNTTLCVLCSMRQFGLSFASTSLQRELLSDFTHTPSSTRAGTWTDSFRVCFCSKCLLLSRADRERKTLGFVQSNSSSTLSCLS